MAFFNCIIISFLINGYIDNSYHFENVKIQVAIFKKKNKFLKKIKMNSHDVIKTLSKNTNFAAFKCTKLEYSAFIFIIKLKVEHINNGGGKVINNYQ